MFDLLQARLLEAFGSAVGVSNPADLLQHGPLADALGSVGLDPSALAGLDPEQIQTLLADHGLDLANLDPSQLADLLAATVGKSGS